MGSFFIILAVWWVVGLVLVSYSLHRYGEKGSVDYNHLTHSTSGRLAFWIAGPVFAPAIVLYIIISGK